MVGDDYHPNLPSYSRIPLPDIVQDEQELVVPERLELPTPTLGMWRSILLSYGTTEPL